MRVVVAILVVLSLAWVGVGCAKPSPTPTGQTIGQLADLGNTVFGNRCQGCHGAGGQGGRAPALVGASSNISKYTTAKGLLDYIGTAMPKNAPASLTADEYRQVVCYLLVQNQFAVSTRAFDANRLADIALKK